MTEVSLHPERPVSVASVRFWTWLAILLSVAVCLAIARLHYQQERRLGRAERVLTDLREGRIDLAKGFLHLTLADDPRAPFRREEGLALLDQAVSAVEKIGRAHV